MESARAQTAICRSSSSRLAWSLPIRPANQARHPSRTRRAHRSFIGTKRRAGNNPRTARQSRHFPPHPRGQGLSRFYAGEKALLGQPGIAVVGSRHLDEAGKECAAFVGNACGLSGMILYSGGAKGVDTISMEAALEARGTAVSVVADGLEKQVKVQKEALSRGDLCLVTPYSPNAGFSVGAAMGRNRLIYTLADYAIVVASDAETGGTWAGATETLKNNWVPVFVLEHGQMPEGNKLLLQKGALAFPHPFREKPVRLPEWLKEKAASLPARPTQPGLF
ncbi:DNA-processing protein DprA [Chloroflexi bacterium CFX6]|nr:DNA-processing protein DprA [Chloroflexi bacterium CFX6]